jgi:alkanesulfonate monooxygenase SsuD/methylene tetrahydromethanopterin reductase-like flavin-dependent oxidoreductase (luciferase family)
MMARMAAAVDDLSGGRMNLGLGAGWQVREHSHFGYDLLDVKSRCDRFEEYVEVVARLLRDGNPVDFDGDYYCLQEAVVLPHSRRPVGPPIVIGGNGPKRTLPIAAKFADEWNGVFLTPEKYAELSARLDALLEAEGRKPADVHRSLMTGVLFGRDDAEVAAKLAPNGRTLAEVCASPVLAGTANAIVDQLGQLANVGVQRVMLQWMDVDDIDGLAALADGVLGQTV